MAQTTLSYNELFTGAFGAAARVKTGILTASLGALSAGTVLVLDPTTNKYVKWDADSEAAVLTVAAPVAQAPAVTTETVIKTQDPEATAAVVKTVAAPVIAAPAVTTATVQTTPIVGLAILLEAKTVTSETTGLLGISGEIDETDLVLAGSTITTVTEFVKAVLQLNGIFVKTGSNALNLAGV
jgi:predicted deacylase